MSLLSKLNKMSSSCTLMDEVPRLPIPINKMNCSVARTSLARLLRLEMKTVFVHATLDFRTTELFAS